jgi:serine protease
MMFKSTTLLLLIVLLLAATAFAGSFLQDGEPFYEFERGEVLVKFSAALTEWEISQVCAEISAVPLERSDELDFWRVGVPDYLDESKTVEYFRARAGVEWANFNYLAHACYTPNDTYFGIQWDLTRLNMTQAWDLSRGSSSVVVAVCDQGYQFDHDDWDGVQIVNPRDCIQNDNNPEVNLYDSHGEHVAGTIIAAINNNRGIAGIAPLCSLMPIRVLNDSGTGTMAQVSNGISWATTHGAHVMNFSFAITVSGQPQDPGPPLSTAITNAATAGIVICAGSGNDDANYVAYPAAYTSCIAVGATGFDDAIAPYSNRGAALDVVAPGGNIAQDLNHDGYEDGIISTVRESVGDVYGIWQGTSMAAPHVTGVAALMLSYGFQASQVRAALQESAADLGTSGWDATFGYGRVNAYAALQRLNGGEQTRTAIPKSVKLAAPYPNPFNSVAVIPLELSATMRVELSIYNLLGQRVTTLLNDAELTAGSHAIPWNAHEAATGLYLVTLQTSDLTQTQKLLLIK